MQPSAVRLQWKNEWVVWLPQNAATIGDVAAFLDQASHLRVVGGCGCGCPSVDFKAGGQDAVASIIADAEGTSPEGVMVGVISGSRKVVFPALKSIPLRIPGGSGFPVRRT